MPTNNEIHLCVKAVSRALTKFSQTEEEKNPTIVGLPVCQPTKLLSQTPIKVDGKIPPLSSKEIWIFRHFSSRNCRSLGGKPHKYMPISPFPVSPVWFPTIPPGIGHGPSVINVDRRHDMHFSVLRLPLPGEWQPFVALLRLSLNMINMLSSRFGGLLRTFGMQHSFYINQLLRLSFSPLGLQQA